MAAALDSLVRAAESVSLTHGDVGFVHGPNIGLGRRDDTVARLSAAHPPPARGRHEMELDEIRGFLSRQRELCLFKFKVFPI